MFTHPGHPINCCLYDGHTESCSMHQSRRAQSTWFQTTKGFLQVKHHIDGLRNNSSVEACITNHPDWAAIRQAPHIQAILPAFPETGKDPIRISKHSWLILQSSSNTAPIPRCWHQAAFPYGPICCKIGTKSTFNSECLLATPKILRFLRPS